MPIGRFDDAETGFAQQRFRLGGDLLAVLQAARGMIRDRQTRLRPRRRVTDTGQKLR